MVKTSSWMIQYKLLTKADHIMLKVYLAKQGERDINWGECQRVPLRALFYRPV